MQSISILDTQRIHGGANGEGAIIIYPAVIGAVIASHCPSNPLFRAPAAIGGFLIGACFGQQLHSLFYS